MENPLATLTPQNIAQPLPDITGALAPQPLPTGDWWCQLSQEIAANPVLAVVAALGVAALLWPKGGR